MSEFFSDLRVTSGSDALKRIGRKVLEDDCFGLAGQLAYVVLFSLFLFLMFLIALMSLVVNDPESRVRSMFYTAHWYVRGL